MFNLREARIAGSGGDAPAAPKFSDTRTSLRLLPLALVPSVLSLISLIWIKTDRSMVLSIVILGAALTILLAAAFLLLARPHARAPPGAIP